MTVIPGEPDNMAEDGKPAYLLWSAALTMKTCHKSRILIMCFHSCPENGSLCFFQLLYYILLFLVYHFSIKLPKLLKHVILFLFAKIIKGRIN